MQDFGSQCVGTAKKTIPMPYNSNHVQSTPQNSTNVCVIIIVRTYSGGHPKQWIVAETMLAKPWTTRCDSGVIVMIWRDYIIPKGFCRIGFQIWLEILSLETLQQNWICNNMGAYMMSSHLNMCTGNTVQDSSMSNNTINMSIRDTTNPDSNSTTITLVKV